MDSLPYDLRPAIAPEPPSLHPHRRPRTRRRASCAMPASVPMAPTGSLRWALCPLEACRWHQRHACAGALLGRGARPTWIFRRDEQVDKEHRWLPVLAPQLPLPVPEPLAKGEPGCGFPRSWSVYRWLDGQTAESRTIADLPGFAADLAAFLAALH